MRVLIGKSAVGFTSCYSTNFSPSLHQGTHADPKLRKLKSLLVCTITLTECTPTAHSSLSSQSGTIAVIASTPNTSKRPSDTQSVFAVGLLNLLTHPPSHHGLESFIPSKPEHNTMLCVNKFKHSTRTQHVRDLASKLELTAHEVSTIDLWPSQWATSKFHASDIASNFEGWSTSVFVPDPCRGGLETAARQVCSLMRRFLKLCSPMKWGFICYPSRRPLKRQRH